MKNIDVKRDGDQLVITIDLSKDCGPSKSGKTRLIGTTGSNECVANVDGHPVYLGLNLYRYEK